MLLLHFRTSRRRWNRGPAGPDREAPRQRSTDRLARNVIGEVKLIAYVSRDEPFRTALTQLLVCAFCQLAHPPVMVMFLGHTPSARHLTLAKRLDVAVVLKRQRDGSPIAPRAAGQPCKAHFRHRELRKSLAD